MKNIENCLKKNCFEINFINCKFEIQMQYKYQKIPNLSKLNTDLVQFQRSIERIEFKYSLCIFLNFIWTISYVKYKYKTLFRYNSMSSVYLFIILQVFGLRQPAGNELFVSGKGDWWILCGR